MIDWLYRVRFRRAAVRTSNQKHHHGFHGADPTPADSAEHRDLSANYMCVVVERIGRIHIDRVLRYTTRCHCCRPCCDTTTHPIHPQPDELDVTHKNEAIQQ